MTDAESLRLHEQQHGKEATIECAERQLLAFRKSAKRRDHFAHYDLFRAAFVQGILVRRRYLRENRGG